VLRVPDRIRRVVIARDGGRCVACSQWVRVPHIQHRIPRGMGGTKRAASYRLSNLLTFCWRCNLVRVERDRQVAVKQGWVVSQYRDPAETKVKYRGRWAMLDDEGGVTYI
jgi:5-methylcytosine-specific restriction protein A